MRSAAKERDLLQPAARVGDELRGQNQVVQLHGHAEYCSPSLVGARVARGMRRLRIHVQVYLTTGDRTQLLERQPTSGSGQPTAKLPTIDVDETKTYQEIVGFGAALTDASAWLIQHS